MLNEWLAAPRLSPCGMQLDYVCRINELASFPVSTNHSIPKTNQYGGPQG